MAKRALLVGCNYPGTKVELHGCANDVKRMHKTLVTRFGFAESDILVLLDSSSSGAQPTGANIRSYLNKLIRGVQPGDVLVFHYSGHGTQVPSEGGVVDETGAEEAIVPTDMNLLTDDDFRELVNKIPRGATFTFISDSCHSGGLIDSAKVQIGNTSSVSHHSGGSLSGGGGGSGSGVGDLVGLMHQGFDAFNNRGGGVHSRDFHSSESRFEERRSHHSRDGDEVTTYERHRQRHGYGDSQDEEEEEYGTSYNERGHHGSSDHVRHSSSSATRSKEIPIGMLTQLLSERVGHQVEVGNIRTTLFDMFGKDASPTVKLFAKLALQQLQKRGHGQEGIMGAVSSLATQLLSARLESQSPQETSQYVAAAEDEEGTYRPRPKRGHKSTDVGVLLSGCQSNETSADAKPAHGDSYGAFSNAIQEVLSQTKAPLSNRELILQVRKALQSEGFKQHPCLFCTDHNADATFIGY